MSSLFDTVGVPPTADVFVIVTLRGARFYAATFLDGIPEQNIFLAPGGEASKTFPVYEKLLEKMAAAQISRQGIVIGVGGGALLDLAGFAAASYLRGVDFCAVPTTFLAMVDAAIGGKSAINLSVGKNLVGAFARPKKIATHLPFLDTLPALEWSNGWAEVVKMGLLEGGKLWQLLQKPENILNERSYLAEIVSLCQNFKQDITESDFHENAQSLDPVGRIQLNFGHTLGHALERATDYHLPHGQAVAIGINFALWLSVRYCELDPFLYTDCIERLWGGYEMQVWPKNIDFDRVLEALLHDKKREEEGLRWVLLKKPGAPYTQKFKFSDLQQDLEEWWALSDSNR